MGAPAMLDDLQVLFSTLAAVAAVGGFNYNIQKDFQAKVNEARREEKAERKEEMEKIGTRMDKQDEKRKEERKEDKAERKEERKEDRAAIEKFFGELKEATEKDKAEGKEAMEKDKAERKEEIEKIGTRMDKQDEKTEGIQKDLWEHVGRLKESKDGLVRKQREVAASEEYTAQPDSVPAENGSLPVQKEG